MNLLSPIAAKIIFLAFFQSSTPIKFWKETGRKDRECSSKISDRVSQEERLFQK